MTLTASGITALATYHHSNLLAHSHSLSHGHGGLGYLGDMIARSVIHIAMWKLLGHLPLGVILLLAAAACVFVVMKRRVR